MTIKSKAAKMHDALRQLQAEHSQHEGMSKAIDEFLSSARPGALNRLHDIVTTYPSKAEALAAMYEHEHDWKLDANSNGLIDVCTICGEERA